MGTPLRTNKEFSHVAYAPAARILLRVSAWEDVAPANKELIGLVMILAPASFKNSSTIGVCITSRTTSTRMPSVADAANSLVAQGNLATALVTVL